MRRLSASRWLVARLRSRRRDGGSAVLEFLLVGVLLTLPVFYLVMCLARLQAGAYAVSSASREAGRMFVAADNDGIGRARADAATQMALADHGFNGGSLSVSCSSAPCTTRGGSVRTQVGLDVQLPFVPDFLSSVVPTSIHLSSRHTETVGRFR